MIDTLNVLTKTMPDTLRIILSSADKPGFWSHYSPLIVALVVVAVSSFFQWYNAYKQRKLEWYKIDDLAWLEVFQDLVTKYLAVIHKNLLVCAIKEDFSTFCIDDNEFNYLFNGLLLHLDQSEDKQLKLINNLEKNFKLITSTSDIKKLRKIISHHVSSTRKIFHDIADEFYDKKNK